MATATKKKWSQEKFEGKLMPILKGLGTSMAQVVESLRVKKIKGDPNNPDECVIAVLVAKTFKDAEYVSVTEDLIEVTLEDETYSLKPPAVVKRMIANFDAKKYPQLVVKGYVWDEDE